MLEPELGHLCYLEPRRRHSLLQPPCRQHRHQQPGTTTLYCADVTRRVSPPDEAPVFSLTEKAGYEPSPRSESAQRRQPAPGCRRGPGGSDLRSLSVLQPGGHGAVCPHPHFKSCLTRMLPPSRSRWQCQCAPVTLAATPSCKPASRVSASTVTPRSWAVLMPRWQCPLGN